MERLHLMKLLIDSDIHRSSKNGIGDQERLLDASKVLDRFSVSHLLDIYPSYWELTIYTQKICLDDISMNTLFANGFSEFDIPLTLTYSELGGEGCEFSMRYGN